VSEILSGVGSREFLTPVVARRFVATLPTLLLHLNIPCVESYLVSSTIETDGVPAS
jgi:hypothetical protein